MTTRLLGFGQVLKPNNPITFAHQIVRLLGFKTYAKPNNPKTLLKPVRSARFESKPIIISRLLGYWVLKPPPKPNNPTVEMKRLLTPLAIGAAVGPGAEGEGGRGCSERLGENITHRNNMHKPNI